MNETETVFPHISGRWSLDFAATLGKRGTRDIERISTTTALADWAVEVGIATRCAVSPRTLHDARTLREAIYRAVRSVLDETTVQQADLDAINLWASHNAPAATLTIDSDVLTSTTTSATGSEVLAAIGRDAVDLLGGPDSQLIRECDGSQCTLLFLDTSRGSTRRWCSMNSCGARTKMRTLRERARQHVPHS